MTSENKKEAEIIPFKTQKAWQVWLEKNHNTSDGIWLRFYKKASGIQTIVYEEALEEALCYGWIDGQLKTFDADSYVQRFTPRRARSLWSKRNVNKVTLLEQQGKMKPSGQKVVEAAKVDGRWEKAYDPFSEIIIPEDFLKQLKKDRNAYSFYESLNKTNKYAISWRLQTAKRPETKVKRMQEILEMLSRGEKYHM
jgi:uncharacterized protein YdeI (YjbR/CyaY-like superfamily)